MHSGYKNSTGYHRPLAKKEMDSMFHRIHAHKSHSLSMSLLLVQTSTSESSFQTLKESLQESHKNHTRINKRINARINKYFVGIAPNRFLLYKTFQFGAIPIQSYKEKNIALILNSSIINEERNGFNGTLNPRVQESFAL